MSRRQAAAVWITLLSASALAHGAHLALAASAHRADAQLIQYPDAGHGSLFQYPDWFVHDALRFLERD